jgi:hypothetical protein
MINIDYTSEEMMSAKYQYNGVTEDGRKFVLHAEWNSWDDYVAEDIEWLDGATGTYDEEFQIYELYQETMNA